MGEVQIEIMPMLARLLGTPQGTHMVLTEPIEPGDTLRSVMGRLVVQHEGLRDVVLDAHGVQLTEFVRVIVNGLMVEFAGGLDTPLGDHDTILLLPAFAGG